MKEVDNRVHVCGHVDSCLFVDVTPNPLRKTALEKHMSFVFFLFPIRVQSRSPFVGIMALFARLSFVGSLSFNIFHTIAWTRLGAKLPNNAL